MKIKFKKIRENAVIPFAATKQSGGLDVTAAHIEHISRNEVLVYLGIAMHPVPKKETEWVGYHVIDEGTEITRLLANYRIRFSPRSSFTGYNWVLQNSPCLGDADFTGEYRLRFRAIPTEMKVEVFGTHDLTYDDFPYEVGDRVAQMWVEEIIPIEFQEVDELEETERGEGGFGSSGK